MLLTVDSLPLTSLTFDATLVQVCTGRRLFPQDISNDNMVDKSDALRLALWLSIADDLLAHVFAAEGTECTGAQREDAKHLIRWCLHGDAALRPTMAEVLAHRFLGGDAPPPAPRPASAAFGPPLLLSRDSRRSRFHIFISHMQVEASGDVGTLFFLFTAMGLNCWRDMNQEDLTEKGMRQGVYDSDLFVLFLTNSMLSRPFCLKEIGWAIEFKKAIVMVAEKEARFWAWDHGRWQRDECFRIVDESGRTMWRRGALRCVAFLFTHALVFSRRRLLIPSLSFVFFIFFHSFRSPLSSSLSLSTRPPHHPPQRPVRGRTNECQSSRRRAPRGAAHHSLPAARL